MRGIRDSPDTLGTRLRVTDHNYRFGMDPGEAVDICSRTAESNDGVRVTGIRSAGPRNNGAVRVDGYVADYRAMAIPR